MSPNISLEEILGIKTTVKSISLLWDRLLSLIDSKLLQLDRGGIGLGFNFGQT
jgi:hypothetical protein